MSLFPLSCHVEDDILVNLLLVDDHSTMAEVAEAAGSTVYGYRLGSRPAEIRVVHYDSGTVVAPDLRVRDTGWGPLEAIRIVPWPHPQFRP